jgi:hypothetical protein
LVSLVQISLLLHFLSNNFGKNIFSSPNTSTFSYLDIFQKNNYRITPFDERYEREGSRKLVFSELYEASKKNKNPWLFELENPGKNQLIDGRTR